MCHNDRDIRLIAASEDLNVCAYETVADFGIYFAFIISENRWFLEVDAEQIRLMQELIREIVAKTMSAQAEEARNKQLIEKKFASVKKQIREVKSSQKAVNTYYQNMMKNAYLDSQFLDRKK